MIALLTNLNVVAEFSNEHNRQDDLIVEESSWWWGQGTKQMLQMLHTHQVVTANAANNQLQFVSVPSPSSAPSTTHIYALSGGAFPVQQPMNTGL